VFITVVYLSTQSGNFWIHSRISKLGNRSPYDVPLQGSKGTLFRTLLAS